MYDHQAMFNRLPSRYRKPTTERIYKVLYQEGKAFFNAYKSIDNSRNIDLASGKTLDYLGGNVGQYRNGEDDDLYRQLIKVRIIANMSIGSIPVINTVMSALVKDVYLGLNESWQDDWMNKEPAAIAIDLSTFDQRFPIEIIEKVKAAGIRVLINIKLRTRHNIYFGLARRERVHIKYLPWSLELHLQDKKFFGGYLGRYYVHIKEGVEDNIFYMAIKENNAMVEVQFKNYQGVVKMGRRDKIIES